MFKRILQRIGSYWASLTIIAITVSTIALMNSIFGLHMKVAKKDTIKGIPSCIEVVADFYTRSAAKGRHMLPVSAKYAELNVFFTFNPQNQDYDVLCLVDSRSKAVKIGCLKTDDYQMPCYTGPMLFLYYEGTITREERKNQERIQSETSEWKGGPKS
jgi:hypothetical protein